MHVPLGIVQGGKGVNAMIFISPVELGSITSGRTKGLAGLLEAFPISKTPFRGPGDTKIPVGRKLIEESSNVTVTDVAKSILALLVAAG